MRDERTPPPDRSPGESYPGPESPADADEPYDSPGNPDDNAPHERQPRHPEKPEREDG
jgi:hypothetical protein